jgi:hypothetical protein
MFINDSNLVPAKDCLAGHWREDKNLLYVVIFSLVIL